MWLAFVRWWVTLLGGVLIGSGLVLHGQLIVAHHSREQVQDTFFLWRGVGQITFVFQADQTQLALWLNEVPQEILVESERSAWALVVIGTLFVVTSAFIHKRAKRRR